MAGKRSELKSGSIKIGLLWHSARSGNLGVGALTIANMSLARAAAADLGLSPCFTIIGMRDIETPYLDQGEAEIFDVTAGTLLSPAGCWSMIGRQDCILDIGGGDSFAEIYGLKRFLFLWLTKMLALARRVPLLLSPQTIGPFTRAPYVQLARAALNGAMAVMTRDRISLDALRELAPRANGLLSVDVAFALAHEDMSACRGGHRVKVGVNVSGLLFNEAAAGDNRFGLQVNYADLMRRFIADVASRADVEVHLIVHVADSRGGWDDDNHIANELARAFPTVVRVPNFTGPSQAKSYISGLDFLVAGRMHACIAAFSVGVPVVPVAYSRKFSGLFGMLDYPWIVPVRGLTLDQALAYLSDCLDRRDQLARDAAAGMAKVEALLDVYRSELRTFFGSVAGAS